MPIRNIEAGHRVTGKSTTEPITHRHMFNRWDLPFTRRFGCIYPASGRHHIIYNCATPIDDKSVMLSQWLYRNDSEEDCSTQELIDWDAPIVGEDREILEATDYDALRRHRAAALNSHGVRQARPVDAQDADGVVHAAR
ncbi:hypothetical protein ACU4GD_40545 [Cupriavidus basilensis]